MTRVLPNFELADVDAEYARLVEGAGLRSDDFGQRRFIVAAPRTRTRPEPAAQIRSPNLPRPLTSPFT
ncbi:hypothetical protein ACWHAO_13470 [Streptomyces albidoflavus]